MLSSMVTLVLSNSGNLQSIFGFKISLKISEFFPSEGILYNNSFVHNEGDIPQIKK